MSIVHLAWGNLIAHIRVGFLTFRMAFKFTIECCVTCMLIQFKTHT